MISNMESQLKPGSGRPDAGVVLEECREFAKMLAIRRW
jgi:hypothetical protein